MLQQMPLPESHGPSHDPLPTSDDEYEYALLPLPTSDDEDEYPSSALLGEKLAGNLLVQTLPTGAWNEWCKDGVVCFGMIAWGLLKIYFTNPRDQSVYHVVDFDLLLDGHQEYSDRTMMSMGLALVNSKIYVLGGRYPFSVRGPVEVYCCDAAAAGQRYGYEWVRVPDLKYCKMKPYLFPIDGKLYVLSMIGGDPRDRFEVLKPDSGEWQVLSPPFTDNCRNPSFMGSLVVEDEENKKILVHTIRSGAELLSIYDAIKDENWIHVELKRGPSCHLTCPDIRAIEDELAQKFNVQDIGLLLGRSWSISLSSLYPPFDSLVRRLLGWKWEENEKNYPLVMQKPSEERSDYDHWHLLSLGGGTGRFCLLGIFLDPYKERTYVRLGTLDLVPVADNKSHASSESGARSKRRRFPGYKVSGRKFKTTNLFTGGDYHLVPADANCTKFGTFADLSSTGSGVR